MEKNLGLVKALISSTSQPTNIKVVWYDENANVLKFYNLGSAAWEPIASVSLGLIRLNSGDTLDYIETKLDTSLEIVAGKLKVADSIVNSVIDKLDKNNNLSELTNITTARTNLDVYSKNQVDTSLAAKMTRVQNLADVADVAASRNNLSIYSKTESDDRYLNEASNLSDVDSVSAARSNLSVYAKSELYTRTESNSLYLDKASNLANLPSVATARSNLSVYSKGESESLYLNEANNLADLDNAVTAFNNIKQNASTVSTGVVEKATTTERNVGTTDKFIDASLLYDVSGGLLTKILEIGDWNMNENTSTSVSHGLPDQMKIRSVTAIIRNDSNNQLYDINYVNVSVGIPNGSIGIITSASVGLQRTASSLGGNFDNTLFDTYPGYNRGWVVIKYLP